MTSVGDISLQDMEKVRSLSLIELTALFDSHGLALHRRKPVRRRVRGMEYCPVKQKIGLICYDSLLSVHLCQRDRQADKQLELS